MIRLVLLSLAVACASAIVCVPEMCNNANCQAVTDENCAGRIVRNGGFCGCCDICVVSLAEGERCLSRPLMGVPMHSECAHGLVCDNSTSTCKAQPSSGVALTCAQYRQQILDATRGMPIRLLNLPQCDADGNYAFRQCRGSVCYCVDSNGQKILDYAGPIGDATMDCQCARDQHAYMQTGLIGKLFFCTPTGNYQH